MTRRVACADERYRCGVGAGAGSWQSRSKLRSGGATRREEIKNQQLAVQSAPSPAAQQERQAELARMLQARNLI